MCTILIVFCRQNLPPGIRNRFTEFYIDDLHGEEDLHLIVRTYLKVSIIHEMKWYTKTVLILST